MGSRDLTKKGFPTNALKGNDFSWSPGCGGFGGGSCVLPATFSFMYYPINVSGFLVYNRRLILQNTSFQAFADGGSDGICAHSNTGTAKTYDVYLLYSTTGSLDTTKVAGKITVPAGQTLPFYLDFNGDKMPQPTDGRWTGRIWVGIDLRQTGLMVAGHAQTDKVFLTTNHDYDERL